MLFHVGPSWAADEAAEGSVTAVKPSGAGVLEGAKTHVSMGGF